MLREWIVPSVRILDDSLVIALGRNVDVHRIEPVGKRRESVVETTDELFSTLGCNRSRLDGSTIRLPRGPCASSGLRDVHFRVVALRNAAGSRKTCTRFGPVVPSCATNRLTGGGCVTQARS